jgi:hypothetical protein
MVYLLPQMHTAANVAAYRVGYKRGLKFKGTALSLQFNTHDRLVAKRKLEKGVKQLRVELTAAGTIAR